MMPGGCHVINTLAGLVLHNGTIRESRSRVEGAQFV